MAAKDGRLIDAPQVTYQTSLATPPACTQSLPSASPPGAKPSLRGSLSLAASAFIVSPQTVSRALDSSLGALNSPRSQSPSPTQQGSALALGGPEQTCKPHVINQLRVSVGVLVSCGVCCC